MQNAKKERKPTRDSEGSILKRIEERTGAFGKRKKITVYYARVRQNEYDDNGKFIRTHELKRKADGYQDAVILRRQLRSEIKQKIESGQKDTTGARTYLFDLFDFYEKHYVKPAVFSGKKKIAGQRTPLHITKRMIQTAREFFGNIAAADMSYSLIFNYKISLESTQYKIVRKLKIPQKQGEKQQYKIAEEWHDRKPATVHRYLACLRRILYVGIQHGFLKDNPFTLGDPLIDTSVEETRMRTCSFEEEELLYSVCVPPRKHLKWVIICAIDTFARENELFSLKGSDIDFDEGFLIIRETNAKTLKERSVPLTARANDAFKALKDDRSDEEWNSSNVFPIKSVKSAWYTALGKTGIEDLHFHDLRATGITRMLEAGIPESVVMKFSGHEQYSTFMKYVRKDARIMRNAG